MVDIHQAAFSQRHRSYGGNGVGIYVPKAVVATALPSISSTCCQNPDCSLTAQITSHGLPEQTLRGIYYNNRHFDGPGSRNEHRLTRWNTDFRNSPAQDPENTGALAIFAFHVPHLGRDSEFLDIWICKGLEEEEFVESKIGEVIPGSSLFDRGDRLFAGFAVGSDKEPSHVVIPLHWEDRFPSGEEIIAYLPTVFVSARQRPMSSSLNGVTTSTNCSARLKSFIFCTGFSRGSVPLTSLCRWRIRSVIDGNRDQEDLWKYISSIYFGSSDLNSLVPNAELKVTSGRILSSLHVLTIMTQRTLSRICACWL